MNARSIFSATIVAVLVFPLWARAQITAPGPNPSQSTPSAASLPKEITLGTAITAALDRNYTVRTAENTARHDEIESNRSTDNLLPSASASAQYGYNYSLKPASERTTVIFDPQTGLPIGSTTAAAGAHSLSYTAGLGFNLYNGGSDAARIRAANQTLDASRLNLTYTRQSIAFNVTSAYLNALRTTELVDAARKTLDEALAQLGLVKGKYDAGVIPIGQVYQQEAVVGQDSLELIQATNNYENAKADVLFLLNVPPNQYDNYTFSLAGIDTSTTPSARAAVQMSISDDKLNAAIDNRTDVAAERHAIQAAIEQITETRGALYPQLDASASIGGSGANSDLTLVQIQHRLTAGLTLSIPIFDKMQTRLAIDEQEVDLESRRIQLEQLVQQIRSDAAKAVNNLRSADRALDASQLGLTSAEESLRLAEERLRVGAGTQVDVVIAEAALETARTNRVNAKFNYVLAQHQIVYTLGQTNY